MSRGRGDGGCGRGWEDEDRAVDVKYQRVAALVMPNRDKHIHEERVAYQFITCLIKRVA